jgi:hypothetical protein
MTTPQEAMRQEFEAWALPQGFDLGRSPHPPYEFGAPLTRKAWDEWQARQSTLGDAGQLVFAIKGTAALLYGRGAASQRPTELWELLQSYLAQIQEIVDAAGRQAALRSQPEAVQDEWLHRAVQLADDYAVVCNALGHASGGDIAALMKMKSDRREALRAHLSARLLPPQGWQMVPVEPDENMERAFRLNYERTGGPLTGGRRTLHFRDAYQAALAAAPSKEK